MVVVGIWTPCCQLVQPSRASFGDLYWFPHHRRVLFETGVNDWDSKGSIRDPRLSLSPAESHLYAHTGASIAGSDQPRPNSHRQILGIKGIPVECLIRFLSRKLDQIELSDKVKVLSGFFSKKSVYHLKEWRVGFQTIWWQSCRL